MRIAGWRLAQRGCLQDDLCCFDPQKTCHRSPAIARTPSVRLLSRLFSFLRFRLPKLRPEIPEFLGGEGGFVPRVQQVQPMTALGGGLLGMTAPAAGEIVGERDHPLVSGDDLGQLGKAPIQFL